MIEHEGPKIRVYLADDHTMVRRGIARLLNEEADMEVVGEAGDGLEAVQGVQQHRPEVVLMDIGMPGLSGIEATRQIVQTVPGVQVLILTVYDQADLLFKALQAGAAGYILKGAEMDDLLRAIRTVRAGEVFIHPQMATRLVQDYLKRLEGGEGQDEYQKLSGREKEILPMLANDLTGQEIAEALHISPYTVQTYRQRIMQKLNLHSRSELMKYALRKGLIRLSE